MNRATATTRSHLGARRRVWGSYVLTALAAVAAIVTTMDLLALPPVVDRITVENPTGYNVSVYVTDNDRDGWMPVGMARPEGTSAFYQIIDHGEMWIFRFAADGADDVELQLKRQQLEDDQWRLPIPPPLRDR